MTDRTELWRYLESFRSAVTMPSVEDIRVRFGEPDLVPDLHGSTLNPSVWGLNDDAPWFARYTEEEKAQDWIEYVEWVFLHQGREETSVMVMLRKDGRSVLGWMWFEDVSEGTEQGPPV